MTFEILAHFAKSENEAYRDRERHLSQGRVHPRAISVANHSLLHPQIQATSKKVGSGLNRETTTDDEFLYMNQAQVKIGTGEAPSMTTNEVKEEKKKKSINCNKLKRKVIVVAYRHMSTLMMVNPL